MRPEELEAESRDEPLRDVIRRLSRQLDTAKASKEELVAAVYRAASDAALAMRIPPVPKPPKDKRAKHPEVAICLLADWQLGKTTPDYDSDVAAERVNRYVDKALRLIELQRAHHPVKEARIYYLGDLVEGEEIFPGQAHRIDASLYTQVFTVGELTATIARRLAGSVERVVVRSVIGNHGAIGGLTRRQMHPETNADAMALNIGRMLVRSEGRIDWPETRVAGERAWYGTDEVLGRRWFLFHGDQIKGGAFGFPWYGFGKKLLGWSTSVVPFTYSASGHFHVPVRFTTNAITHWGAGSPESANTYAQEYLASGGQRPSQWLLFQGEDGVTAEYEVHLDR